MAWEDRDYYRDGSQGDVGLGRMSVVLWLLGINVVKRDDRGIQDLGVLIRQQLQQQGKAFVRKGPLGDAELTKNVCTQRSLARLFRSAQFGRATE